MPSKQQSIILGGLTVAVLSTSYLSFINFLCCLGVIAGALVAVWHYTDENEITLKSGDGATMGVLAALFGLVVATVLNLVLIKMGIRHDQAIAQFMINKLGDSLPPESIDQMRDEMNAEITALQIAKNLLWGGVIYTIFGAIGGVLGAKMFKKGGDEPSEFAD